MIPVECIRPLKDQVLVLPDPVRTMTAGGLHIPQVVTSDNPNFYTMTGRVLKVGPGGFESCVKDKTTKALTWSGERTPLDVQAGDRVVFSRYAGKQLPTIPRCLMLREHEILGIAEGEYVEPGYQAAKFSGIKSRAGDDR